MIDGFNQPLALILFPSTRMPGGTLLSTSIDRPVTEYLAALFLLTTGNSLALMLSQLARLRKYCHIKLGDHALNSVNIFTGASVYDFCLIAPLNSNMLLNNMS